MIKYVHFYKSIKNSEYGNVGAWNFSLERVFYFIDLTLVQPSASHTVVQGESSSQKVYKTFFSNRKLSWLGTLDSSLSSDVIEI